MVNSDLINGEYRVNNIISMVNYMVILGKTMKYPSDYSYMVNNSHSD